MRPGSIRRRCDGSALPSLATAALATLAALAANGCGAPPPPAMLHPAGSWTSSACEPAVYPYGVATHRQRRVTLTDTTSEMTTEYFDDMECTMPTLTVRVVSTYAIGAESTSTPGAFAVDFTRQHLYITPRNPQLASFLMMLGCPGQWTQNIEQEMTGTDCFDYVVSSTCPTDLELMRMSNDQLTYGQRTSDGHARCADAQRPTALESVSLVRMTR